MFHSAFDQAGLEVDDMIAEGDKVFVLARMTGTQRGEFMGIPATGRHATVAHMYLFRLDAGQITEYAAVRDDLGMMRQLGLMPARG